MDRMISLYRISARTKKWTVRAMMHMVDFSIVNSWLEHREVQLKNDETPMKLLDFKMSVARSLIYSEPAESSADSSDSDADELTTVPEVASPIPPV